MNGIFVFPQSSDSLLTGRVTTLENETIYRAYYQIVTGTSGSITTASGVALVAGQFGLSGNSILSQINVSNYPIYNSPTDVSGDPVTATLDVSTGAWTTSAAYTQTNIAIFFVVTGSTKDIIAFESIYPGYVFVSDIQNELVAGAGISIIANVISATGTGTVTSVSGTSNRITSTGGTTPIIDISASYVGQASITTLGTIGTGTWQGTAIADTYISSASTWNGKQAALVSGTNIKTVNGSTLLGSGNLAVGDALVANPLSQFASTTSAQLAGVISDETGSGSLVFATSPTLVTPTLGVASATALNITGTAGAGFTELIAQSAAPSAPSAAGLRLFSGSTGNLSWMRNDGGTDVFRRTFSSTLTANRTFTFQDATYTLAGIDLAQTWTAQQSYTNNIIPTATNTYNLGANSSTGDWLKVYSRNLGVADAAGTNVAGTNLLLTAGIGTGTGVQVSGVLSTIDFTGPMIGSTGSTPQTTGRIASFGYDASNVAGLWIGTGTVSGSNYVLKQATSSLKVNSAGTQLELLIANTRSMIFTTNKCSVTDKLNALSGFSTGSNESVIYRTTNGGSDVLAHAFIDPASSLTSGLGYGWGTADGHVFTQGNGTRRIAFAAIKGVNLTSTANSEAGDIGLYTQAGGSAVALRLTIGSSALTIADAINIISGTTTGTKLGTGTTQKWSIWNATPIVQPTTAIAASTFVANTSAIANDTATFDGYTIGQVVKALRNFGLLA